MINLAVAILVPDATASYLWAQDATVIADWRTARDRLPVLYEAVGTPAVAPCRCPHQHGAPAV